MVGSASNDVSVGSGWLESVQVRSGGSGLNLSESGLQRRQVESGPLVNPMDRVFTV